MRKNNVRSPFFYVGDKYKLMPQLKELFPSEINSYYEPFLGGGSSALNTSAKKYVLNDIDENVLSLHKFISSYSKRPKKLLELLLETISKYELSCSYLENNISEELKKKYPKTYFAKYNKKGFLKMRDNYNQNKETHELYLLLIYGFNRMIRFNRMNHFNVPVGNLDFNQNVVSSLKDYLVFNKDNNIEFSCQDYITFIKNNNFHKNDFIYLDPPYLITNSEYNKLWSEEDEKKLYETLDELDKNNIKFGLSNIVKHKGKQNKILEKWMKKYYVYDVKSNYISRFDNSIKSDSREVYITNYEKN